MTHKGICKDIIQGALRNAYGFKPTLKDITILESSDNRTYILARVGDREYRFDSFISGPGTAVWVGDDCITMTAKYSWNHKDGHVRHPIAG